MKKKHVFSLFISVLFYFTAYAQANWNLQISDEINEGTKSSIKKCLGASGSYNYFLRYTYSKKGIYSVEKYDEEMRLVNSVDLDIQSRDVESKYLNAYLMGSNIYIFSSCWIKEKELNVIDVVQVDAKSCTLKGVKTDAIVLNAKWPVTWSIKTSYNYSFISFYGETQYDAKAQNKDMFYLLDKNLQLKWTLIMDGENGKDDYDFIDYSIGNSGDVVMAIDFYNTSAGKYKYNGTGFIREDSHEDHEIVLRSIQPSDGLPHDHVVSDEYLNDKTKFRMKVFALSSGKSIAFLTYKKDDYALDIIEFNPLDTAKLNIYTSVVPKLVSQSMHLKAMRDMYFDLTYSDFNMSDLYEKEDGSLILCGQEYKQIGEQGVYGNLLDLDAYYGQLITVYINTSLQVDDWVVVPRYHFVEKDWTNLGVNISYVDGSVCYLLNDNIKNSNATKPADPTVKFDPYHFALYLIVVDRNQIVRKTLISNEDDFDVNFRPSKAQYVLDKGFILYGTKGSHARLGTFYVEQ